MAIHDFNTDTTTTYDSVSEASQGINVDSKVFWTKEKAEIKSNEIIPYKGRYVITILREGITESHQDRVELARKNLYKGLINLKNAQGHVVVVTNIVTKESVHYNSVSEAARDLNVDRFTISRRLKSKKVLDGTYIFSYL